MRFNEIIGNQENKSYLNNMVNNKKILHSYLFTGIDGIGKRLIAEEFARKILCENDAADDCNCKSCRLFNENSSPDYLIIDEPGNSIKIDTIRSLMQKVVEKPIFSKRKVYIINDFGKATKESQNCLLKTLEEPPEYVTMILIASEENNILTTIKSRCTKVSFLPLSDDEIKEYARANSNIELTREMIDYCAGSIGKVSEVIENEELYQKIGRIFTDIDTSTLIDFLNESKVIYDKEKITSILDYITIYFYSKAKEKDAYLDCIGYVNEAVKRLGVNTNFEMSIDNMLFKIWEAFNEKGNRC